MQLAPSDKEARDRAKEVERTQKRIAFEQAIAVEDVLLSTQVATELDSMAVDPAYDGVHLPSALSAQLVRDLLAQLRAQKRLHVKCVLLRWATDIQVCVQPAAAGACHSGQRGDAAGPRCA